MRAVQRISWVDAERGDPLDFQRIVQIERLPDPGFPVTIDGPTGWTEGTVTDVVEREGYLPVVLVSAIDALDLAEDVREDPARHMARGHWSPGHADVEDVREAPEHTEPRS